MKVVTLPTPIKKGLISWSAKPKFSKKGDDASETYSDIVPYKGGLLLIGNIVLESSPPPSAWNHSTRCCTADKSWPPILKPSIDAPPSNRTCGNKRKTSLYPHLPLLRGEYVISNFLAFLILIIYFSFLWLTVYMCFSFI